MRTEFECDPVTGGFRLRTSPESGGIEKLIIKLKERIFYYGQIDAVARLLVKGRDGFLYPDAVCNNRTVAVALLLGKSFGEIYGSCFEDRERGKLAFFDPYAEAKFEYA